MQASIGKTYNFADDAKPISVANTKGGFNTSFNTDGFEGASKPQGLRGYFYGSEAQHIGGAYYTEDGAGAFITEKQ